MLGGFQKEEEDSRPQDKKETQTCTESAQYL